MTKGGISTCDEERAVLQSGQVFAMLRNGKYILISVKYCPKCNRCYLSNIANERIHKELGGVRLVAETRGRLLNSTGMIHVESQGIAKNDPHKISEIKLNVQSPLKALGYDTTKSDKERWRILQQLAIPKLGKRKVIYYLEMFSRMGKIIRKRQMP